MTEGLFRCGHRGCFRRRRYEASGVSFCRSIRYPTPMWVWMYWGWLGSVSSFFRRVAIKTRREGVSEAVELPQIWLRI